MEVRYDGVHKARTIEWLSEMGFDVHLTPATAKSKPASVVSQEPHNMSILHTASVITVCLLLLGYCFGVMLFPNL